MIQWKGCNFATISCLVFNKMVIKKIMPFQKGNKYGGQSPGRPKGSKGAQRKEKLSSYYEAVLEAADPKKALSELLKDDPKEFMRQYISLLPKEQQIELEEKQPLTDEEFKKEVKRLNQMVGYG